MLLPVCNALHALAVSIKPLARTWAPQDAASTSPTKPPSPVCSTATRGTAGITHSGAEETRSVATKHAATLELGSNPTGDYHDQPAAGQRSTSVPQDSPIARGHIEIAPARSAWRPTGCTKIGAWLLHGERRLRD